MSWIGKELVVSPRCQMRAVLDCQRPAQRLCQAAGRSAVPSLIDTELRAGRSEFEFRQEQAILLFLLYQIVQTGPEDYPVSCTMGAGARRPGPAADN
jgi:hypothetical protein